MFELIDDITISLRQIFSYSTADEYLKEKQGRLFFDKKYKTLLLREDHLKKLQTGERKPRNQHEQIWATYCPAKFAQQLASDWERAGYPSEMIRVEKEYKNGLFVITNDVKDEQGKVIGTETKGVGPILQIVSR